MWTKDELANLDVKHSLCCRKLASWNQSSFLGTLSAYKTKQKSQNEDVFDSVVKDYLLNHRKRSGISYSAVIYLHDKDVNTISFDPGRLFVTAFAPERSEG